MNQSVSVVICTTGRTGPLMRTLESLADQSHLPQEVLLIDQSGKNDVYQIAGESRWPFQVHSIPVEFRSLARGRNYGVRALSRTVNWVLFLDDDVVLNPSYIAELLSGAERHPSARILFGAITNLDPSAGIYNAVAKRLGLPYHGPQAGYRVTPSFKTTMDTAVEGDIPADWATGCGFMVRNDTLEQFLFDDNLVRYSHNEDVDFSFRVGKANSGGIWCIGSARLQHLEAPANRLTRGKLSLMRTLYDVYLFKKNRALGLSVFRYIVSELAFSAAIFVATIFRVKENPYPLGPHLHSYLLAFRHRRELMSGDLSKVNQLFS